jgi:formamidopyrimidine-DNA glycosylase
MTWHFGMTGEPVFFDDLSDEPRFDRFLFTFEHGYLAFEDPRMLGRIGLTSSPKEYARAKGLGPDAMAVSRKEFLSIIGRSRGAIKPALLDQGKIAGIGNIYSDEMLFQARIDPRADISMLDEGDLANLHRVMRRVFRLSIDRGTDFSSFPDTYLLHYRRKGAPCPRCGGTMETITLGGRTAYYCPACQRRGGI